MYIIQLAPNTYLGNLTTKVNNETKAVKLNRDEAVELANKLAKDNPNVIIKLAH